MASSFQNRLVGSIVFIALIVIFLPDLLDGKKIDYGDQFQTIPHKPNAHAIPVSPDFPEQVYHQQMQQAEQIVEDEPAMDDVLIGTSDANSSQPLSSESSELITDTPATENITDSTIGQSESKPLPKETYSQPAWVIQLGSFSNINNVRYLEKKLRREGYVVFTKPVKTNSGMLTKVFIGPDLDKAKLEAMLPALKKLTDLSGKLANYQAAQ